MKKLTFTLAIAVGFAFTTTADAQFRSVFVNPGYGGVTVIQPGYSAQPYYSQSYYAPAYNYARAYNYAPQPNYMLNSYRPAYNTYNSYNSYNSYRQPGFSTPFGGVYLNTQRNYGYSSFYSPNRFNRW